MLVTKKKWLKEATPTNINLHEGFQGSPTTLVALSPELTDIF